MLQDYKDMSVCVVDNGIFTGTAVTLAKSFGTVYYHTPWACAYPKSDQRLPGKGVPGIIRKNDIDFPDFRSKIDLWVFPDLYRPGLQTQLRDAGKRVWGSMRGEQIELYRNESKKYLKKLGLPVGEYEVITGIDDLRAYLKEHDDVYIKISVSRGDFETKGSKNYSYVEPWLNNLQHTLGAKGKIAEFIVEQRLDAVAEIGYDGFNVYGQWPESALVGLEVKDKGYLGHVNKYSEMPKELTEFTEAIGPTLKGYEYANFLSTENRVMADNTSYMNDFCGRQGSPPSELYLSMIENIPDIMYFGAEGKLIQPEWAAQWGAEVIIDSSWHDDKFWQHISFPESLRENVNLRNFCMIDDEYYVLPLENSSVGAAVATGATMDEARKNVQKVCEQIEGDYLEIHSESLDEAEEEIENLTKAGITL